MHIELPPELESIVSARIATGQYTSTMEVVAEALVLLDQQDRSREAQLREFNEEIDRRIEEMDRGEEIDAEEVWAYFDRKVEERRKTPAKQSA